MVRSAFAAVLLLAGACASAPEAERPVGPPVVSMTPGLQAPPQARLYAECISSAAEAGAYVRERDGKTLRFTCVGPVAKWFYEALAVRSAEIGSEYVSGGRTWRFTQKLVKDAYGVDNCSTDGAGDYQCHVILAVGDFIEQPDYRVPKF